jgi:DNA-binding transcriptional MocR family regulator
MPVNDFTFHPLSWQPDPGSLSRPRYLSLAARLAHDIDSGILPPGACLPPQRELADWLDINFTTVTRAYDICRERGLVYGVTGRGTFVSPVLRQTKEDSSNPLDLRAVQCFPELGENLLVETAKDVLNRDYSRRLFSYTERKGSHRHCSAGAFWISRLGKKVRVENTIVFPGVHSALVTIMLAFFDIGDAIAVDEFTYGNLIEAARFAHIKLIPVQGDREGMIPEMLHKASSQQKIKGVFLMPTCANPTTATMSMKRKDALASVIKKRSILVLEDDATLIPDGSGTFFERLPEQTFHLTGSTRFLAAGLRVAFVLSPDRLFQKLLNAHHRLTIKASAFDTEIMSELILSGRAEKLISEKIKRAKEMNSIFKKIFPSEKRNFDDTPFFRTVSLPSAHRNGPEIERELHSLGVHVCHSYRFSAHKNPTSAFLRVSLSSVKSKSELERALKIVAKWIKSEKSGNKKDPRK